MVCFAFFALNVPVTNLHLTITLVVHEQICLLFVKYMFVYNFFCIGYNAAGCFCGYIWTPEIRDKKAARDFDMSCSRFSILWQNQVLFVYVLIFFVYICSEYCWVVLQPSYGKQCAKGFKFFYFYFFKSFAFLANMKYYFALWDPFCKYFFF